jgi:hypothetical protein
MTKKLKAKINKVQKAIKTESGKRILSAPTLEFTRKWAVGNVAIENKDATMTVAKEVIK